MYTPTPAESDTLLAAVSGSSGIANAAPADLVQMSVSPLIVIAAPANITPPSTLATGFADWTSVLANDEDQQLIVAAVVVGILILSAVFLPRLKRRRVTASAAERSSTEGVNRIDHLLTHANSTQPVQKKPSLESHDAVVRLNRYSK